jgi:hypothetical protein
MSRFPLLLLLLFFYNSIDTFAFCPAVIPLSAVFSPVQGRNDLLATHARPFPASQHTSSLHATPPT